MKRNGWGRVTTIVWVAAVLACGGTGGDSSSGSAPQPTVVSVSPAPDDSAASAVAVVSATFDANMGAASAATFVVYGSLTGKRSGTFSGGGTAPLSFDPSGNFKAGELVEVTLTQGLASTGGLALDPPYVFRFTVETGGGTGAFVDTQTIAGRTNAVAVAAGDWDGDGDVDLATADFGADRVTLLANDGAGGFFRSGRSEPPGGRLGPRGRGLGRGRRPGSRGGQFRLQQRRHPEERRQLQFQAVRHGRRPAWG